MIRIFDYCLVYVGYARGINAGEFVTWRESQANESAGLRLLQE